MVAVISSKVCKPISVGSAEKLTAIIILPSPFAVGSKYFAVPVGIRRAIFVVGFLLNAYNIG